MSYPKERQIDAEITAQFNLAIEAIVSVRRCKTLIEKGNQKIEKAAIKFNKEADTVLLKPFIEKLGKVEEIEFVTEKLRNCVTDVSDSLETMISTDDIDMSAIIAKLTKQKEKLEKEIGKLNGMLGNEKFVANAPEQVITQNRQQLEEAEAKLEKIEAELAGFSV